MQFQMLVTGAERTLFAWERHNDRWPNPTPYPVEFCWVLANKPRQALLKAAADRLLEEVDAAKVGTLPWDTGDVPTAIVDEVHKVLEGRNAEALGKTIKEAAWKAVQAYLKERGVVEATWENEEAKVTWATTPGAPVTSYDLTEAPESVAKAYAAAVGDMAKVDERIAKARAALAKAEEAKAAKERRLATRFAKYQRTTYGEATQRLTITAKSTTTKEA